MLTLLTVTMEFQIFRANKIDHFLTIAKRLFFCNFKCIDEFINGSWDLSLSLSLLPTIAQLKCDI